MEKGSLLAQLARALGKRTAVELYGSLKNMAQRLLESLRYQHWPDEAFDPTAARAIQIRLDSSSGGRACGRIPGSARFVGFWWPSHSKLSSSPSSFCLFRLWFGAQSLVRPPVPRPMTEFLRAAAPGPPLTMSGRQFKIEPMEAGRKTKLRILSGHDVPAELRGLAALRTIIRIFGRLTAQGTRTARRHGLSLPHVEVLLCLDSGEGVSQQDLAERLLLTKGNICVIVQKMEAAGLIERRSDPDDQRFHRLYLTPAGREKLRAILPEQAAQTSRVLRGLSPAEQRTLHELLCRVDDAFDEEDG
jgi:DNA-binding MarR family transcriptional regulator